MATANVKYTAIVIDKLAGGLADTGNPSVIDKDQSPCLYNVDFSRFGSVMARNSGNRLLGNLDPTDEYGPVLALKKICYFDSCNWFREPISLGGNGIVGVTQNSTVVTSSHFANYPRFLTDLDPDKVGDHPTIQFGNNSANRYTVESITDDYELILTTDFTGTTGSYSGYYVPDSPMPAYSDLYIRGVGSNSTDHTYMQYLRSNGNWTTFDIIAGQHPFDIEIFNGVLYYSNGIEDLRMATICPVWDHSPLPTVVTDSLSQVRSDSLDIYGNVILDGGLFITERGFVYADEFTTNSPTLGDSQKIVTGTTGIYLATIDNLNPGTKYYIAAYATNASGTSYGEVVEFKTLTLTEIPQDKFIKDTTPVDDPLDCDRIIIMPAYPTCENQYGANLQTKTVISSQSKFVVFGNGKYGPDMSVLQTYYAANPAATLDITAPDPNSPNKDNYTFQVSGVTVQNNIIYWTTEPGINKSKGGAGTFYDRVILTYGGTPWSPVYCGSAGVRTAEKVRGYILKIFENRLFIAGNLEEPDKLYYSKKTAVYADEPGVAIHVGDFDVVGFNRTIADADRINFTNACAHITALAVQGGKLYTHRETNSSTEIYSMELVTTDPNYIDGYYRPVLATSSSCAGWFRDIEVVNDFQWYISTFYGIPENKQFGLFVNFTSSTTADRSQNIRRTMSKMDFRHGAVAYFNRKIFYAGRYIRDDEQRILATGTCYPDEHYAEKPNDTLLVFDIDSSTFTIYKNLYVNVFHLTNSKLYYGSSIDSNVWELVPDQLVDNLLPDGSSDDIPAFFSLKRFNFNTPGVAKQLFRVYLDGYLSPGTSLEFGIIFDCNRLYKVTINYSDIKTGMDCLYPDCEGIDCEGCRGQYNSVHFQKHIEFSSPAQFITMQPYLRSEVGFWQVDTMTFFVNQLPDDDLNSLLNCGALNTGGENCFRS
jgi:hypothetical protein